MLKGELRINVHPSPGIEIPLLLALMSSVINIMIACIYDFLLQVKSHIDIF